MIPLSEETNYYFCNKVGHDVIVALAVHSYQSSMDPTAKVDFVSKEISDCGSAKRCGVKDERGDYDWSLCEYET